MKLEQKKLPMLAADAEAFASVQVGMTLYGYCLGLFGRDSYGEKRIVSVSEDHITVKEGLRILTAKLNNDDWADLVSSSNYSLREESGLENT